MIVYTNIKRYEGLTFEQYLKLEGYSHSYLKREVNGMNPYFEVTENVRLGSLVDAILTDPRTANMLDPLYPAAREIAAKIKERFGHIIQYFVSQVSYTATINHCGFEMPVKGRLDWEVPGYAVIDLKVTKSKDIRSLIDYMKYKNQCWHYAKLMNVIAAYIMIYSVPLKKVELIPIDCSSQSNEFFEEKILKFGRVAA